MMWVLLHRIMWPYSSASVLWSYGDTGLEVHNSYVVTTCFTVKLLHSSDLNVCVLYKIVFLDFGIKTAFSVFSRFFLLIA